MIDLYYWTTPNGNKVTVFLEEAGLDYNIIPVDIGKGEQFEKAFLRIAPNNRIPAIVDHSPADGGAPLSLFESGAILQYLAEKSGQFMPSDLRGRTNVMQWLFWQMGGLGPMLGQNHHFRVYAQEKIPYAITRYVSETSRLYQVMENQLKISEYLAGDYSIADIACYPWIAQYERQGINLGDFPKVERWFAGIGSRPAVKRAYEIADEINTNRTIDKESAKILFNQSHKNLAD